MSQTSTSLPPQSSTHLHHHIIPLDFTKLLLSHNNKLPETHTWPDLSHSLLLPDQPNDDSSLPPVIDLSDRNAVHLVRHACTKWGAFQVTSHNVPVSLLDEVETETRKLFRLPMERKMMALRQPEIPAGYGLARVSSLHPKGLWSEGFTILGPLAEHAAKLWPVDEEECDKFCSVMKEYQQKMEVLAQRIISLMVSSLGLSYDVVSWMRGDEANRSAKPLQLNSYPVCPNPAQAMGMAPHTDTSLVTILYQGNVGGLQVQSEAGGWVTVPPVEGALVVNLGDLMHILSNGEFRSVMHRALVNGSKHRVSVAYFYGPPKELEMAPAARLVGEGKSPVYRSVTWNEYQGLKGKHGQKALEMIKRRQK